MTRRVRSACRRDWTELVPQGGWGGPSVDAAVGVSVVAGRAGGDRLSDRSWSWAAGDRPPDRPAGLDGQPGGGPEHHEPATWLSCLARRRRGRSRTQLAAPSSASWPPGCRCGRRSQARLEENHSPQQIATRLRADFPDDPEMRVSHETIYQALYVQGRGGAAPGADRAPAHRPSAAQARRRRRGSAVAGSPAW